MNAIDVVLIIIPALMILFLILTIRATKGKNPSAKDFVVKQNNHYIAFKDAIGTMDEYAQKNGIDTNGDFKGYIQ